MFAVRRFGVNLPFKDICRTAKRPASHAPTSKGNGSIGQYLKELWAEEQVFVYRDPQPDTRLHKYLALGMATGAHWWIWHHIFVHYDHLIPSARHIALHYPEKWTDEQLGIPPDDAD